MNSTPLTHEDISCRARELWLARGCPVGSDLEIWLEAERSLLVDRDLRPPRRSSVAADEIDEAALNDRLSDFGGADRRSVSSAEPQ